MGRCLLGEHTLLIFIAPCRPPCNLSVIVSPLSSSFVCRAWWRGRRQQQASRGRLWAQARLRGAHRQCRHAQQPMACRPHHRHAVRRLRHPSKAACLVGRCVAAGGARAREQQCAVHQACAAGAALAVVGCCSRCLYGCWLACVCRGGVYPGIASGAAR